METEVGSLQSCLQEETLSREDEKVGGVLAKTVGGWLLVNAKFGARKIQCLLDTGSQVTTVTESFFRDVEPACQELLTTDGWLTINAANGLVIPYVGIVSLLVEVEGNVLPDVGILVVKDPSSGCQEESKSRVNGIIGTNVLSKLPAYKDLIVSDKSQDQEDINAQAVLRTSFVKISGHTGVVIPPLSVSRIDVVLQRKELQGTVLVEPLTQPIRGAIQITPTIFSMSDTDKGTLQAINMSAKQVVLPPRTRMGKIGQVETVEREDRLKLKHVGGCLLVTRQGSGTECTEDVDLKSMPPVDISGFKGTPEQLKQLQALIMKHYALFLLKGSR